MSTLITMGPLFLAFVTVVQMSAIPPRTKHRHPFNWKDIKILGGIYVLLCYIFKEENIIFHSIQYLFLQLEYQLSNDLSIHTMCDTCFTFWAKEWKGHDSFCFGLIIGKLTRSIFHLIWVFLFFGRLMNHRWKSIWKQMNQYFCLITVNHLVKADQCWLIQYLWS